ncbi:heme oxygenase [Amylocystis lapponica]|nr:heme oxygenase [Amylocystis lapponica]
MATEFQDLDFKLPIASLLQKGTAEIHERVENGRGAGWLVRGELDREEYARFLMMLWYIYGSLERAMEEHASCPTLQSTYRPAVLSRSSRLSADISSLLHISESSWQSHPVHVELLRSPPPEMTSYVSRIESIADSADPSTLLAHAYVRYLGDLSGGQTIRRRIAKAYDLEDGIGTSFYDFQPLEGTGCATTGDVKKIKDWYRVGMNTAVGDNDPLKAAMLREAIIAFELNDGLLESLHPPSMQLTEEDVMDEAPAKVVYEEPSEGYRLSTVISVIAALSLAHFILVVGGFTGEKGSSKLEAFQQWLAAA